MTELSIMQKRTIMMIPFQRSLSSPVSFVIFVILLSPINLVNSSNSFSIIKGSAIKCSNEGEPVKVASLARNPCIQCKCILGEVVCKPDSCGRPCHLKVSPSGQSNVTCCRRSWKDGKPGFCSGCLHYGVYHQSGSTWKHPKKSCFTCKCKSLTFECRPEKCPKLACLPSHQIREPGECCPTCYEAHEPQNSCVYEGQPYRNGETWKPGERCTTCNCTNGDVKCYFTPCNINVKCPPGQKLVYKNERCCPICQQDDGSCRVEGNPATLYTFDGYSYKYSERCNHVLTRDCSKKDFSVHLINSDSSSSRSSSSSSSSASKSQSNWHDNNHLDYSIITPPIKPFNTIIVKLKGIKVRITETDVRIGQKSVQLPYIALEVLSISREGQRITVRSNIGVRVTWDRRNFTQVIVPKSYKNRVCGLCGNFNGYAKDDLKTKRGIQTQNMQRFFNSWKIKGHRSYSDADILKLYQYTRTRTKKRGIPLTRSLTRPC